MGSPREVSQASSNEPNSDTPILRRKTLMVVLSLFLYANHTVDERTAFAFGSVLPHIAGTRGASQRNARVRSEAVRA
jgi:hypothetical protein